MIGPLTRIILFVHDVPQVAAFYRDVFDLEVIDKIDPEWTELRPGNCNIALHKAHGHSDAGKDNRHSPAKIVFGVKDVAAAKKLVESRGGKMKTLHTSPNLTLCDGLDPAGNPFQLSNRGLS